ncbi:hypothetical protein GOP47_0007641 [Adiantum capillus-veneris]|uniref:Uncharacterized protein n=1 Tax=Adiantum capillus-veneris TaxID=13818 RepID=A0A9D4V2K1_ADICA|nr:hypothetical protein GOP47_0007641 [Adiantum capillus-veneris]
MTSASSIALHFPYMLTRVLPTKNSPANPCLTASLWKILPCERSAKLPQALRILAYTMALALIPSSCIDQNVSRTLSQLPHSTYAHMMAPHEKTVR